MVGPRCGVEVTLGRLEPGTQFRLAAQGADPKTYELLEHTPSASVVRRVIQEEQIEFVREDGTAVQFDARARPRDRWAPSTRVVVR